MQKMPYGESEMLTTKERLEDLRKEKKLSFEQLSRLLEEHGATISHSNLRNYEINDETHKLYNRTRGMSIENLVALAEVYDVSVDYLLGRSRTKKAEYQQLSEELRLSDEAIDILKNFAEDFRERTFLENRSILLDELLRDADMLSAFEYLQMAVLAMQDFKRHSTNAAEERKANDKALAKAEKVLCKHGLTAVDARVVSDVYISRALLLIEQTLRKIPEKMQEEFQNWLLQFGR